jgi:hypothetical protein
MQAAIDAGVPVRPVRLRHHLAGGEPTTVATWVGSDTLLASVWRVARTRGLTVRVDAAAAVATTGRTRREVVAEAAGDARRPVAPLRHVVRAATYAASRERL